MSFEESDGTKHVLQLDSCFDVVWRHQMGTKTSESIECYVVCNISLHQEDFMMHPLELTKDMLADLGCTISLREM